MLIKVMISVLFSVMSINFCLAQNYTYSNDGIYSYENRQYSTYEDNDKFCGDKTSFLGKLKNAFIGTPTGYTPQIEPSPYLNSYGPSYMRGYYGSNGWNNHNVYNPIYSGAGLHILH